VPAWRGKKTIESETVRTSEVIKKKLGELSGTVKESLDEVSKSDFGRKIKESVEEAAKTAKQSAESVSKGGEKLGKTAAFRALSQVGRPAAPAAGGALPWPARRPGARVPTSGLSPPEAPGLCSAPG